MKTMKNIPCDSMQHLMVDALFDGINLDAQPELKSHLQGCETCSKMFAEMQATLQITKQVPDIAPPESYWIGFQERLEDRIAAEQYKKPLIDLKAWGTRARRFLLPQGRPQWAFGYQLGLAVVLVLIGVFIGRLGLPNTSAPPALTNAVDSTAMRAMQVAAQTESYLNRSSVLLLGLVNHDTINEGAVILNFDHKREVAGTLVQEAALLKASLNHSKEAQLFMLIEELEKVLLQIANLEIQEDLPGIEMIQEGIEGRALLLKINLETMKLMDQPASAPTEELAL